MALGSRGGDVAAEKAASLERVTVDPAAAAAAAEESAAPARRSCCPLGRVLTLLTLAACCLCLGFVELHRLRQGAELQRQLAQLQMRLDRLESEAPDGPRLDEATDGGGDESALLRSRRSVGDPLRTIDGVPILDEPYGLRSGTPSQGLSLYGTLQAQREGPPPTDDPQVDDPSIRAHHRSSAAYQVRFGRVNTDAPAASGDDRSPGGAASAPTGRRAVAPGELHRRSRAAPVLEARGSPTAFVPGLHGGAKPHQQQAATGCVAAHFEGHVSQLSRKTSSYGGNGRLRNANPDGMFANWRPADWMEEQRCDESFQLYGGQVTVTTPGLYYLYAQINYLEDNDINAFEIQVNARSVAKCIAMEASDLEEKINTCHTGAVTYLGPGDAVSIRDLEPNRYSILLWDRSFFGLVRLSSSG
ncbi:protein eiger-like isoform X4 [Amphibalanus amphitrite]|uniref:protein eiger-like isoform X4 n=1 Tax=Amphibalanus amphitrite TaxID=1232801 RepID=UPI001C911334|nr:protein eiger-like isoform X4 [Amphibalanus amphitrite]